MADDGLDSLRREYKEKHGIDWDERDTFFALRSVKQFRFGPQWKAS
jgi:hypothetical protein